MARNRDYAKEYRQRQAKAAREGYTSPRQASRRRAAGKPTPADTTKKQPRQVFDRPGGKRLVQTTKNGRGFGVLKSQLGKLAPGTMVTVTFDFDNPNSGAYTVTRTVPASELQDLGDDLGDWADYGYDAMDDEYGISWAGTPVSYVGIVF